MKEKLEKDMKENKIIWNISEIIKKDNEAYTGINKISENIIEVFLFIGVLQNRCGRKKSFEKRDC